MYNIIHLIQVLKITYIYLFYLDSNNSILITGKKLSGKNTWFMCICGICGCMCLMVLVTGSNINVKHFRWGFKNSEI